MDDLARFPVKF